jgi:hypothetical protein
MWSPKHNDSGAYSNVKGHPILKTGGGCDDIKPSISGLSISTLLTMIRRFLEALQIVTLFVQKGLRDAKHDMLQS